jgi:hypothetical protein
MSFLFPRVISVTRPASPAGVGAVGYMGVTKGTETPIIANIPASIQAKTTMARQPAGSLPAASPGPIVWRILIPLSANVARDVIKDRDLITDDLGDRYQVEAAYWGSLGWNLATIRLEAH